MGLFDFWKRKPQRPDDKIAGWIFDQIDERAHQPLALAEAAAALSGQGSMVFGMVINGELAARDQLRDKAVAALAKLVDDLPDEQCARVFDVIETSKLPVDFGERRARLAAKRELEGNKAARWLRAQIEERKRANDAEALAGAVFALRSNTPGIMAFGMVVPAELPDRDGLRDACLDAIRACLPALSREAIAELAKRAQGTGLPADIVDALAARKLEVVAERRRERERIADAGESERDAGLEAAIASDDVGGCQVYADWLESKGHPRGALLSLMLRAETDPALAGEVTKHIEAHADVLLGPLHEYGLCRDGSNERAFIWRRGFIRRARIALDESAGVLIAEVLGLVLAHPSARYLAELVLGMNGEPGESLDDAIELIAGHAPPSLVALELGDFVFGEQIEMSWYTVGDVAPLWPAVPQLRRLAVQGGSFQLGTIDLPALEHAEFRTGGLSVDSARAIATARWPKLRHLDVWTGDPNYDGDTTLDDVQPLLARADLPDLVHLGIRNCAYTDDVCGALAASRLAAQVRELDVSLGTMSDAGVDALVAAAPKLARLEWLDISGNYVSLDAVAALRRVYREVIADQQRNGDDRYPAVGE